MESTSYSEQHKIELALLSPQEHNTIVEVQKEVF